jgi:hypothetical protein
LTISVEVPALKLICDHNSGHADDDAVAYISHKEESRVRKYSQ